VAVESLGAVGDLFLAMRGIGKTVASHR
jgi:hypothetical protein